MDLDSSRRSFLKGLGAAGCAAMMNGVLVRAALAATGARDLLVTVFLRGGMDGLNAVVPVFESAYFNARPTIRVPESQLLPLDNHFGLHPKLAPLHSLYTSGRFAIVHAAGNPDPSRSHFAAQKSMEYATWGVTPSTEGWMTRHYESLPGTHTRWGAVSLGYTPPVALYGSSSLSMSKLSTFRLLAYAQEAARFQGALWSLYGAAGAPPAGSILLSALTDANAAAALPASSVTYPSTAFGSSMKDVAQLVRAGLALETVNVDLFDWDLHVGIGDPQNGALAAKFTDLAGSLAAFAQDLGTKFSTTTIVVMSEFGRRVAENGGGGTDHGHGGCMFVLGGGIRGGKVYGTWPGLSPSSLDQGDLAITTDYRDVLAEVVAGRLGNPNLSAVFPGYTPKPVGLVL